MSQLDDSRKIIDDLRNDGCVNRKESERCAFHRGDKSATHIYQQHYEVLYPPEGEK